MIGKAQSYLWGPVVSALHVAKSIFKVETGGAEVDNLNFGAGFICEKDVLWFQIAMDHAHFFHLG
jgi:hypothetical protein